MRIVIVFLAFFLLISLACMETTQATPNKGFYAVSRKPSAVNPTGTGPTEPSLTEASSTEANPKVVSPGAVSSSESSPTAALPQASFEPTLAAITPAGVNGVTPPPVLATASADLPGITGTNTFTPDANSTPAATQAGQPTAAILQPTQFEGEPGFEKVLITTISYDGSGQAEPDEFVEIGNQGDQPVQLQGWTIKDDQDHLFTFPQFTIQPDQVCRVYTNEVHSDTCGFSFGSAAAAVWNNDSDCATLEDDQGILLDQYCYQE